MIKITTPKFVEKAFTILDKKGQSVAFSPNRAQLYYESKRKKRNIILKARQQGISKYILARNLMTFLLKPTNCLLLSNETEATKRMMASARYFLSSMKVPINFKNDEATMIRTDLPSTYFIGTAGQKIVGRGDTLHKAHLSEAGFYDNLEKVLNGVQEACEFGDIDIESTPNGYNYFRDLYFKAKKGESSFNAIFIPWYLSEEYSIEYLTKKDIETMTTYMQDLFNQKDEDLWSSITEDEKKLIEKAKAEYNVDFTAGMIKWRRYKIEDKGDLFFQEYPEDDITCFLRADRGVFIKITHDDKYAIPLQSIKEWYLLKQVNMDLAEEYEIGIYNKQLYGGIDPAEGTPDGDYHCFAVYDTNHYLNNKGAFIYEYRSREPIDVFASKVAKICKRFNIKLGCEKNGVGLAMCNKLDNLDVVYTSWQTTGSNRPVMISDLSEAYRKEEVIETEQGAVEEAMSMIYDGQKATHPKGGHDDRVFARAIALQMSKTGHLGIFHL